MFMIWANVGEPICIAVYGETSSFLPVLRMGQEDVCESFIAVNATQPKPLPHGRAKQVLSLGIDLYNYNNAILGALFLWDFCLFVYFGFLYLCVFSPHPPVSLFGCNKGQN